MVNKNQGVPEARLHHETLIEYLKAVAKARDKQGLMRALESRWHMTLNTKVPSDSIFDVSMAIMQAADHCEAANEHPVRFAHMCLTHQRIAAQAQAVRAKGDVDGATEGLV